MARLLIPSTELSVFQHLCWQEVHIWFCDLSQLEGEYASFATLLSTDERTRAARFAFEQDRRNYTLSHGLLRGILAGYLRQEPGQIEFETGRHGKPAVLVPGPLGPRQNIHFSLAHTGEYAVVAVAMGRAIGVDVEFCRPGMDYLKLAQRFFTSGESKRIAQAAGNLQRQMFYRYWIFKEAYLKGRGLGLSRGLDWFELLFDELWVVAHVHSTESGTIDTDWFVHSLQMVGQLAGAFAVQGEIPHVQMLDARTMLFS